ncbi:BofC C-terminal domain-containing protein [Brevibacillus fulvus]|uniref:Forespore regulator of the sigma-K checkpoint n=1 Tax=Brevibacillus fulvus TaxID=1125967 RepID=A0A939BP38_9BACL|nr:BofC C-terminal domain-containing protein [Brevibacillus fulvus]MBM7589995.1 forespore regulator of the sigma-K checkpoint [Brevibacillus fulvus]
MKKLRMYSSISVVLFVALLAGGGVYLYNKGSEQSVSGQTAEVNIVWQPQSRHFDLVLARTYLCGLKDEEHVQIPYDKLAQSLTNYAGWEIITSEPQKLILLKRENDLAPACKANGYFGLTPDGMLTLFNGLPQEQDVIQTFYQINTERMKATLPKEEVDLLFQGIRVRDLAEYNSVLSTYGEFQLGAADGHH